MLRGLPIARVAVFDPTTHVTEPGTTARLRSALHDAGVDAPVLAGARSHFTELNREWHRLPRDVDGVTFATTPLFHTDSTEQLRESVRMQRLVAQQAVRMTAGTPVHIGPVTLRPRFNNVPTRAAPPPADDDLRRGYGAALTSAVDDRQASALAAAWLLASAAAMAIPGVESLTYFEEWGPRGIVSVTGEAYPVRRALEILDTLSASPFRSGHTHDGQIWALQSAGHDRVHVANIAPVPRVATIDGVPLEVEAENWSTFHRRGGTWVLEQMAE